MMRRKHKGRGATVNLHPRYRAHAHEAVDDGWGNLDETPPRLNTTVTADNSRSLITHNRSPDLPFDQSVNVYRGCEHGCSYCFARPTHAYLDLSPGLDFESRLLVKPEAARLLRQELGRKDYRCRPLAMGTNTDPYQPIERQWRLTRAVLEVLDACSHPVSLVTKSALIERDLDILASMAERGLVQVMISITTLNRPLARRMEPRAAAPQRRLETLRALASAGIPAGVMVAPVIPVLNDAELETILQQAAAAGARCADYILLRLPLEVEPIFSDWLQAHYPLKAAHVLAAMRASRGGKLYAAGFHQRLRGQGEYANMLGQRFRLQCKRLGLVQPLPQLETRYFKAPRTGPEQLELF